jgi:hypothetical protein
MKDVSEVKEKDLKAAITALNATEMLEEKIVMKGKTTEDLMEALLDGVEELDDEQQSTLPANVIAMYNNLIEDEVGEEEVLAAEDEEEETEAGEDEEEDGGAEEIYEENPKTPVKEKIMTPKKKPAVKEKTKEAGKPKKEESKGLSSSNIAMRVIADNPEATEEDIQTALEKAGVKPLSSGTIDYLLKEVKYIVGYLKESGKLK